MEFLQKLREALGLDAEATEDQVLEALTDRHALAAVAEKLDIELDEDGDLDKLAEAVTAKVEKAKTDADEVSLEDRAKAAGKRLVAGSDYETLMTNAAEGKKAADELKQSKFDNAYDKALDDLCIDAKPETKERFQKLYEADADTCLETLKNLQPIANAKPAGSGKGPKDAPAGVDADSYQLDQEVQAYMAEHDDVDYPTALDKVLTKRAKEADES